MHRPLPLQFGKVGSDRDPLVRLTSEGYSRQAQYLRCYLHDLGARSVVVEPNYFDRDYLSEFGAFYSTSTAGYPNICQRVHYFSSAVTRAYFMKAAGGNLEARGALEKAYLGHVVLRPISGAPIGRTVVKVYPDAPGVQVGTPRIMEPARLYECHVAGLTLGVSGIAWQQQDSAVGACATVALWSMLHSSAFDDRHSIPTTASITEMAHRFAPTGRRMFPDSGLELSQILGVINGHGLAPQIISGDLEAGRFSRGRFCSLVASFLRSGYPVLVSGWLDVPEQERELHTVCIVGFRAPSLPRVANGAWVPADENIEVLYIHDDNLGPNARFEISVEEEAVSLVPTAPPPRFGRWPTSNPTETYHNLEPTELVVAVHIELRTDPLSLQRAAARYSEWLPAALEESREQRFRRESGMVASSRFIRLHDYVDRELASTLSERDPSVLARARLALWEKVVPMSYHLGLVRVSLGKEAMMDLLFDTSDSDRHLQPKAYVAFHPEIPWLLEGWGELIGEDLDMGTLVRAW
jgi:hypothetical protein